MTKKINKLTIVLPVYNGSKSIVRTLNSLTDQTSSNFNLVIIDNYSNDRTYDICKRYKNKFDWITLIRNPYTTPMPINWGIAIDSCNSTYVSMIHADDYYDKNFVKKVNFEIQKYSPELIICNAKIVNSKSKLLNVLSYDSKEINHKTVLSSFPGIQRQIWRRNKINHNFKNFLFPTFDYVWFYQNIQNINEIKYIDQELISITSDINQSTNNINWEWGIIKSIIFIIFCYGSLEFKKTATFYLLMLLKDHIYKRIYNPNLFDASSKS